MSAARRRLAQLGFCGGICTGFESWSELATCTMCVSRCDEVSRRLGRSMTVSRSSISLARQLQAIVVCALVLAACPEQGRAETVYSGLTVGELAAFAMREGWNAQVHRDGPSVVRIDNATRSIRIEMFDCDRRKRCKSGLIQDQTYYALKPDRYGFWHWNLERRGATGFGPSYVTLQRYLHFNGVTDSYLRDVIGDIWPKAARSFWEQVEQRYEAERKGARTGETK